MLLLFKSPKLIVFCTAFLVVILPASVGAIEFKASRLLNGRPVITAQMFQAPDRESDNINGPSVIRIPDWIPTSERAAPTARYYCYFAHHHGRYIRLAWAEAVTGAWHLYHTGEHIPAGDRGVLDLGISHRLSIGNSLELRKHIASPDVHVDHKDRRLIMYFHGPMAYKGKRLKSQRTFVATSEWGLDFSEDIEPVALGADYFRIFRHENELYALAGDTLFRAPDARDPWTPPQDFKYRGNLWSAEKVNALVLAPTYGSPPESKGNQPRTELRIRHVSLYRNSGMLYVFYTAVGHSPERIFALAIDLAETDWKVSEASLPPYELLRPSKTLQGIDVVARASEKGSAKKLQQQLRDPFVFEDEGNLYLCYLGGGERAIGLAKLEIQNTTSPPTNSNP